MSPMPQYVEYGGRISAPPPFLGREGTFRSLLLEGDRAKIDAWVERVLNVPACGKVVYRTMGSQVMLQMGNSKLSSTAPGFDQMGFVRETQLSFWIPLEAGRMKEGVFVPERMCMTCPFIFVDNPMSYMGGREDFGFAKSMGIFYPGSGLGDAVAMQAFGGDYAPSNEAEWVPLLNITRAGSAGAGPPLRSLAEVIDELPCAFPFLLRVAKDLLSGTGRQVFLKEFRDCANPSEACYQAIVESAMRVEDPSFALHVDRYKVQISAELGIAASGDALLVAEIKMNMTQEAGTVVAP
jgi:hypothetical protein